MCTKLPPKKKVLFCIADFKHGGINKALENILSLYDRDRLDVGIFVVNQEDGPYKEIFKPYLKYPADNLFIAYCTYLSRHTGLKKFYYTGIKACRKLMAKLGRDPFNTRLNKWAKRIERDQYDCIIAYAEGYISEFVSNIKGNKAAWIHIDYKRLLIYSGNKNENAVYKRFDNIVIPSKFSAKSFEEVYPELKDKIRFIPNLIDTTHIKELALQDTDHDASFTSFKGVKLVSVGRICYEKRFFEIPTIAKGLVDKGIDFKWYIVGDGSETETNVLRDAIRDNNVSDRVILLGRKDNPYPYIAKSDLLVSTSFSETFSYVVFEAKTLGTPIVCADFGTAPEIINDSEGIISPLDRMADEIVKLISESEKLNKLKSNLANYQYDNEQLLTCIYDIIENN